MNSGEHEIYYGVGMTIHEVYDGSGATTADETITKEFIYDGLDRPIVMFHDADNNGSTGTLGGREAYFYHSNPRGDIYAISAGEDVTLQGRSFSKGDIVERYEYSLYGDHEVTTASYASHDTISGLTYEDSAVGNPFMWGGGFKDNETCFMYMRHRYYDKRLRGFISRDPIEADSLRNLYTFVDNNPGSYTDPMGLMGYGMGGYMHEGTRNQLIEEQIRQANRAKKTAEKNKKDKINKIKKSKMSINPKKHKPSCDNDFEKYVDGHVAILHFGTMSAFFDVLTMFGGGNSRGEERYHDGDNLTELVQGHPHMQSTRDLISGVVNDPSSNVGDTFSGNNYFSVSLFPDYLTMDALTHLMGSFNVEFTFIVCEKDGKKYANVSFHVFNRVSMESALRPFGSPIDNAEYHQRSLGTNIDQHIDVDEEIE